MNKKKRKKYFTPIHLKPELALVRFINRPTLKLLNIFHQNYFKNEKKN